MSEDVELVELAMANTVWFFFSKYLQMWEDKCKCQGKNLHTPLTHYICLCVDMETWSRMVFKLHRVRPKWCCLMITFFYILSACKLRNDNVSIPVCDTMLNNRAFRSYLWPCWQAGSSSPNRGKWLTHSREKARHLTKNNCIIRASAGLEKQDSRYFETVLKQWMIWNC